MPFNSGFNRGNVENRQLTRFQGGVPSRFNQGAAGQNFGGRGPQQFNPSSLAGNANQQLIPSSQQLEPGVAPGGQNAAFHDRTPEHNAQLGGLSGKGLNEIEGALFFSDQFNPFFEGQRRLLRENLAGQSQGLFNTVSNRLEARGLGQSSVAGQSFNALGSLLQGQLGQGLGQIESGRLGLRERLLRDALNFRRSGRLQAGAIQGQSNFDFNSLVDLGTSAGNIAAGDGG